MNLLLDTHILLWHLADSTQLSLETSALIENEANAKFLSRVGWFRASKPPFAACLMKTLLPYSTVAFVLVQRDLDLALL